VVADQTYRQRDEPQGSKEKPPDGGPLDLLGSLLQRDRPGECAVRAISVQSVVPIGEDRAATEELRPVLLLAHEFAAERPNQKWIADFTCIWTAEGWLHHQYFARHFRTRFIGWIKMCFASAFLEARVEAGTVTGTVTGTGPLPLCLFSASITRRRIGTRSR
jgi:hypothetical protein